MKNRDKIKAVEIFSGTLWEAELLKSMLENAEIETFIKDDIIGTTFPFQASPGGANPIKIIISSVDLEKAKLVVADFWKNKS